METGTQDGNVAITQAQFDELQKKLNETIELMKAKDISIEKLENTNKNLVDEKRAEESKVEQQRHDKLTSDGKFEELLQERQTAWDGQTKAQGDEISRLTQQLNGMTGDGVLDATLNQVGVNPSMASVVRSHFRNAWEFGNDGTATHNGKPLAESIKEWADSDAGKPFLVSTNSGSGASPTTPNQPSKSSKEMSFQERIAALEAGESLD